MSDIAAEQKFKRIEGGLPPSFEEIGIYRRHLARLRPNAVDEPRFMQIFDPTQEPGRSIYASFTDAELLETVLDIIQDGKKGARWECLNAVYAAYLEVRFGSRTNTEAKALAYCHYRELEQVWPADWPERVSPEGLLQYAERRGITVTEEMCVVLNSICERARKFCEPPTITKTERSKLGRLGSDCSTVLRKMNIPVLSTNELRYLRNYWREQRAIAKFWGEV